MLSLSGECSLYCICLQWSHVCFTVRRVRNQCAPFGVPVENWNKTFMDGRVFGALVASLTDGIDFDNDIKDDDRVGNMKLAFAVADEDLQIPPILSADDEHIGTRDGEKQVMTYCAMFMDKYGSGQKIPPRPADGKQCFAYGPGLESGKNHAEQRCKFTVQCVSPQGKNKKTGGDDVEVTVKDGAGNDLSQVDVKDNGDGTYSVSYLPQQKGAHVVDVRVNGDEIKENPFNVDILRRWTPTVAGMSIAYGPGLETGKVAGVSMCGRCVKCANEWTLIFGIVYAYNRLMKSENSLWKREIRTASASGWVVMRLTLMQLMEKEMPFPWLSQTMKTAPTHASITARMLEISPSLPNSTTRM